MARDVNAGRAYIEFFLKNDAFRRDLRSMRFHLSRFRNIVTGIGAAFTAVGVAAGTVAVAGIIKATNAAGNLAETVSKFETVFGDRASVVRGWAEETAAALGITRREALSTLSSFQDLFVPMGIGAMQAEEMSKQMTQLAVDLASFNNMNSADVVRDLQAAMTGSSETMKKYGSIVNQTAVNQELLNREIDPKDATEAQKAMVRLDLIMRTTTAAQGDAIRTADSYNNSLRRMKTSIEESVTELGEKFLPLLKSLAQIGVEAFEDVRESIVNMVPEMEALDDVALAAAKQGRWDLVGQIIGAQISLGVRRGLGPTLHDFLFKGLPMAVSGAGGAVGQAIVPQTARVGISAAAAAVPRNAAGENAIMAGFRIMQEQDTARMQMELRNLIHIAEKQLKEQQRTNNTLDEADELVLQ